MEKDCHEQSLFETQLATQPADPVECQDMMFQDDEKRRLYFLEKLCEKSLLKALETYRSSIQKRLKMFHLDAVCTGFKKACQERDYGTIIALARKILENGFQEDAKLLMWYDWATTRTGGQ